MKLIEFDPSQFEGEDGKEKYREWLKSLTRAQLLDIYDRDVLADDYWDDYWLEQDSRDWPIGKQFRLTYLSLLFKDFNISGSKKAEKSFEAILERLEPQVAGMQKKLDRLLKIFDSKEVTMSVKTALSL